MPFLKAIFTLLLCHLCALSYGQERFTIKDRPLPLLKHKSNNAVNRDSVFYFLNLAGQIGIKNPDSALKIIEPLLLYSQNKNYKAGIGYALTHMANVRKYQGRYEESLILFNKAKPYCILGSQQDTGYVKVILASWYNNIGGLYVTLGKFNSALESYYKGITDITLKGLTQERDSTLLTTLIGNLAAVYLRYNENDKALHYFNIAEPIALRQKNDKALAQILSNKASAYNQKGELDSALITYKQALNIPGDSIGKITVYSNLGILMLKQGKDQAAVYFLKEKIKNLKSFKENRQDLFLHFVLGEALYKTKSYNKAIAVLLPAIQSALAIDYKGHLDYPYQTLALVYEAMGNFKEAYKYEVLHKNAYRESTDKRQLESINLLEAKYQTLQKDNEIAEQQLLIAIKDNKLKQKNIWIIGIAACLLFLTILFLSFRINSKRKQKIKHLEAIMKGEENERSRIAKDLHDGVNQTIGSAKLSLMSLESEIPFSNFQQEQQFKKAIELVDDSFIEVRQLSHNMMPRALGEASLEVAITQLVASLDMLPLQITLYTEGIDKRFDPLVETFVYRLVQECANNVIRHAQATRLDISVIREEAHIDITIEDNGIGFDPRDKAITGMGLKNIVARVQLLKGRVEFDTAPGKGTLVVIAIPVARVGD